MFNWFKRRRPNTSGATDEAPTSGSGDPEALRAQGNASLETGDLAGAEKYLLEALKLNPEDTKALTSLGYVLMQRGNAHAALTQLKRAVALQDINHDAHYMMGLLKEASGDLPKAVGHFSRAMETEPSFDPAARDLSRVLFKLGRTADARTVLQDAIARNPMYADYYFYLGNLHLTAGDSVDACTSYEKAVCIDASHLYAYIQLGVALEGLNRLDASASAFNRALSLDPTNAGGLRGLGRLHLKLGSLQAAVDAFRASLQYDATSAEAFEYLGHALYQQGRMPEAVNAYQRALVLDPQLSSAQNNLGNALVQLNRAAEALTCYRRAVEIKPDFADALVHMAQALSLLKRPSEARGALERALAIDSKASWLYGSWLHTRMRVCDWHGIHEAFAELARRIEEGARCVTPWAALAAPLTARQQRLCATTYVNAMSFPEGDALRPAKPHDRIRLGYFSADFHGHATAYLMAELFERHNRERFEIFAFSFGPRSADPMRTRLEAAFDRFLDVSDRSDQEITDQARDLQIDIAIDLKGFTEGCRSAIFSRRAAPIQVSYIGFPGTMGAPFIDYLIADRTVAPTDQVDFYSEKLAWLPHSYQANDSKREISGQVPTRLEAGLPEHGFVFCCFNNNYKITPDVFDVWMRLLQAVPGSVLWLLEDSLQAAENLRKEAAFRGVSSDRLIFARRIDNPDHLARHQLADLFIDTLHCNAHTTASDALWAGLPLLSLLGGTFAGRVAGSLTRAAGLPELLVTTLEDYERVALQLATSPTQLGELRERLAKNRLTCPLFDGRLFTHHLEEAYEIMWQRSATGQPPDHIYVGCRPPGRQQ